jgi:hypothetical protein
VRRQADPEKQKRELVPTHIHFKVHGLNIYRGLTKKSVVLNDACMIYYVMAMSGMYWMAGGSED